jgi:hypothetical protein
MRRAIQSLRSSMAPRPINLVLDWDGTITTKDTMFAYGKVADIRDARLGRNPTGTAIFNGFGKAWMDDYTKHEQDYTPKAEDRQNPSQEIAWLKSLSAVENSSAERVESSGFFAGVTLQDVSDAAKVLLESGGVSLRAGWQDVFSRAFRDSTSQSHRDRGISGFGVSILSVNWSESFIRRSLMAAASRASLAGGGGLEDLVNGSIKIIANEISGLQRPDGSSGLSTDPDHAVVRTSSDKLQNFKIQNDSHNIYVGDSATDFDCLLAADLGICVRDAHMGSSAKTLADTLSRVGHNVRHVGDIESWQGVHSGSKLLWASDFKEILNLLERLQESENRA